MVLATVARVHGRRTRTVARWWRPRCPTPPGGCRSPSSTSPGGPSSWRSGTEALFFGKLDEYRGGLRMTNPVVDVVVSTDEPPGRRRTCASSPSTRPRPRPACPAGRWASGWPRPSPGRLLRRPPARAVAAPARPGGADRGLPRRPPPRDHGRHGPGPPPAGLRRAVPAPAGAGAPPPGRSSRTRGPSATPSPRARRRRRPGPADPRRSRRWSDVPGRAALRADQRPAQGPGRDLRRPGRPAAHAPAPPGRRGVGQDRGGRGGAPGRGPGRPPGRAMVPTEVLAEQHHTAVRRADRRAHRRRPGRLDGRRPLARRPAHQPDHRRRAGPPPPGLAGGHGRPGGRHPRPLDRRRAVPLAGGGGHRRAAPLRGRAARRARGPRARVAGGDGPPTPTCW